MEIELVRMQNLHRLIAQRFEKEVDFCRAVGWAQSYWSQLKAYERGNPKAKKLGSDKARDLEERLSLPRGELDKPPMQTFSGGADALTGGGALSLADQAKRVLPEGVQRRIDTLIIELANEFSLRGNTEAHVDGFTVKSQEGVRPAQPSRKRA
jgi:hypothetical protein